MTEQPETENSPWIGLALGLLIIAASLYVLSQPAAFEGKKASLPWIMAVGGLLGSGMAVNNVFRLYALHVRKTDLKESSSFAAEAWASSVVGIIKWGGGALALLGAYDYLTGPFSELGHGIKLLAILLGVIAVILFCAVLELEKINKKLP